MSPEIINLVAQLGIGGVIFWLLLEEKKARKELEDRIFKYLDERIAQARAELLEKGA